MARVSDDDPTHLKARPDNLEQGDRWTHVCRVCFLAVQQGRPGLAAHMRTVHPEESTAAGG